MFYKRGIAGSQLRNHKADKEESLLGLACNKTGICNLRKT
jgi:hypothetical protein